MMLCGNYTLLLAKALPSSQLLSNYAMQYKNDIIIDDVRYGDFDKDPIEKGHRHYGLFQKRKAFEHERELRATILLSVKDYGNGQLVPCDLDILITRIYVSPLLEDYVKDDTTNFAAAKQEK